MAKRALLAAVAVAAFCAGSGDTYTVTSTPTAAVPTDKRVSTDQQFTKTWEIRSRSPYPMPGLMVNIPSRVFISHADNTSSDSSAENGDLFGRVIVSGSSAQVVEFVAVNGTVDSAVSNETVSLVVARSSIVPTGTLLVEVELLRKNALKLIGKYGDSDVVVLENVLYSKDQDPFVTATANLFERGLALSNAGGKGTIFVSDKSGALAVDQLSVTTYSTYGVQIELGGLKINGSTHLITVDTSNVTMFVDDLNIGEVEVRVPRNGTSGRTCISTPAQIKLNVTVAAGAEEQLSYPGKQIGAFACTKQALPERVPVRVGKQGGEGKESLAPSAAASWRSLNALALLITTVSTSFLLVRL